MKFRIKLNECVHRRTSQGVFGVAVCVTVHIYQSLSLKCLAFSQGPAVLIVSLLYVRTTKKKVFVTFFATYCIIHCDIL